MKTTELANSILKSLEQNEEYLNLSEVLDYALAETFDAADVSENDIIRVYTIEAFGESEGIYVDLFADLDWNDKLERKSLITFKSLKEDKKAWMKMGTIASLASWEAQSTIKDITWKDYSNSPDIVHTRYIQWLPENNDNPLT